MKNHKRLIRIFFSLILFPHSFCYRAILILVTYFMRKRGQSIRLTRHTLNPPLISTVNQNIYYFADVKQQMLFKMCYGNSKQKFSQEKERQIHRYAFCGQNIFTPFSYWFCCCCCCFFVSNKTFVELRTFLKKC